MAASDYGRMTTNLDRFKRDLSKLISLGREMSFDLTFRKVDEAEELKEEIREKGEKLKGTFEKKYQLWYTEASALIKQLMPDRFLEFSQLYHGDGKRKNITGTTYNIQDWLNGLRIRGGLDDLELVSMQFNTQLKILESVQTRFESSLFDVAQVVRADLFDSELDAARELAINGFLRGAGAIAGVILEKHLAYVSSNHNVSIRKQHPTINDLNESLKAAGVLDVLTWRQIQRLGDIRNLCDHNKHREPTKDEVIELIDGVEKISKTLL
jgi:hypothetical protein